MNAIEAKIEAYTPDICVLDFRDVTFMDSSGIAVVINALRNMAKIDGKLELAGLQPQAVFQYFEEICAIPHGSGNTKAISDFLVAFAKCTSPFSFQKWIIFSIASSVR